MLDVKYGFRDILVMAVVDFSDGLARDVIWMVLKVDEDSLLVG